MIQRLSERVSGTGSLQGEGIANILGRPPFDCLTLLLREAAQNIWDARVRTSGFPPPKMLVRARQLQAHESDALRATLSVKVHDEREPGHSDELARQIAKAGPVRVVEIADFNTVGLKGGTDPRAHASNFVRFFFDIGTSHFSDGDGGTYGYGRSSLYLASAVRTILVDSVPEGAPTSRRFMGCRIGRSYQVPRMSGGATRFTGRHFWGVRTDDGSIDPLTGSAARWMAEELGMPVRSDTDYGTTILIPWPEIAMDLTGERICDVLLKNLWPKLVAHGGQKPMEFEVNVDGADVALPDPCTHPVYGPFAEALVNARSRSPGAGAVPVMRYARELGHLAFASQLRTASAPSATEEADADSTFGAGVSHVALMRPSELVVRYMEVSGLDETRDLAGVFLCSDEDDIRNAFAQSEPPAHDDWVPDRLEGEDKSFVRVALRKIPELTRQRFAFPEVAPFSPVDASLAGAGDRFAERFLAGDGTGAASRPGASDSGGGTVSLPRPEFNELRMEQGTRRARFRLRVRSPGKRVVRAMPSIVTVAGGDLPGQLVKPVVSAWIRPDGQSSDGDVCVLDERGDYFVDVDFRGHYAIELEVAEEEEP